LDNRINPAVPDSDPLEVQGKVCCIVGQIVGDGRDIVACVALTSDVEISTLELWVGFKEPKEELHHVLSYLIFIGIVVENARAARESSAHRLVYKQKVANLVPGMGISL
jgi:hypothetical protein